VTEPWMPRADRLDGRYVLVLAETPRPRPSEHPALQSDVLEAEEAVMSLVRAVLSEGGTVMLRADPALAILAAVVAGEYARPYVEDRREARAPQLSLVVQERDMASADVERLEQLGLASIVADEGSKALFDRASGAAAMVCVGTGSAEEVAMFREFTRGAPVFVMGSTGGGARELASAESGETFDVIDASVDAETRVRRERDDRSDRDLDDTPLPPVTLSAQVIVERLLSERRRGETNP
jgi:hypothetical protein